MPIAPVRFESGDACNFRGKSARGEFTLYGDKETKPEKPHTIIHFPGGHVEISRTSDDDYWVHFSLNHPGSLEPPSEVIDARIDTNSGRYTSDAIKAELRAVDFQHVALRVRLVAGESG